MLDRKFFVELSKDVVPMFRKHTFINALDVNGKKFKGYSTDYGISKRSGTMFRQASEFKDTTAPILSSDLLRDYKLQGTSSSGFKFGFATRGGRVEHLAKMGRVISSESKPIPDKIGKFVMAEANKYFKKELGKIKGGTLNI